MDAGEFRRASLAVWEAMAPGWDRRHAYLEEIARPVTERMLARLEPRRGQTILDLAAGTGVAGFAAAALVGPEGHVIVSDFAEAMVESAAGHADRLGLENVECRVLDAESLDLDDDSVDGVLCRWGYMLMGDPGAALAETRRVLRAGGGLSCAVFTGPEENPWAALALGALVEREHMPSPAAGAPGIFSLADRSRVRSLFVGAGFDEPALEDVPFTWTFDDLDGYWDFITHAAGGVTIVLDRLEHDERERVAEEIRGRAAAFAGSRGVQLPGVSLVASAT
jgi:ubiquinone/menaquinone biosynthesis C-methylase UbiE